MQFLSEIITVSHQCNVQWWVNWACSFRCAVLK